MRPGILAELDRRRAAERAGSADGVNLLTYHRAKGLEWDAVALPMLEDGSLPIRQAFDDDALLDEERRLLYVGITRARMHLVLISWAAERETRGRTTRRQPSRFLADLRPRPAQRVTQLPDRFEAEQRKRQAVRSVTSAGADPADDDPLMAALRAWRTARARADAVPPYVVFHDQTLAAIAEIRPVERGGAAARQGHRAGQARDLRRRDPRGRAPGGVGEWSASLARGYARIRGRRERPPLSLCMSDA